MTEPIAVIISDIHFSLSNLPLASASLSAAVAESNQRNLPLIIAGDLHDTKAMLRAECVDAILSILDKAENPVFVLQGNHDLRNQHSGESALGFLKHKAGLITHPVMLNIEGKEIYFIPYQHSQHAFIEHVSKIPAGSLVIAHQGFQGAAMGDYLVDTSNVPVEAVAHVKVISGHYHRSQKIGTVEYIGSPYTITNTEHNDGPKGFKILFEDGSTELIPLSLRKHVVAERTPFNILDPISRDKDNLVRPDDILCIKVTGTATELAALNKDAIGRHHLGHSNFRLDKIPTDTEVKYQEINHMQDSEILSELISTLSESDAVKTDLSTLVKKLLQT